MNNLKEVSKIDFYHNGGFWGFRTWTLVGYDGDQKICSVNQSDSNNYLKYVRFIQELKKNKYKLRLCDRQRLKSGEKGFMNKSLISKANKGHLYEIASYAGYSKDDVDNIKNKDNDYKNEFALNVGLEQHEFDEILKYI